MTLNHWLNCKHAPSDPSAKHCSKYNTGDRSDEKRAARKGKRPVGKGYYGCVAHCRFYEAKKETQKQARAKGEK